ncbi:MAG TPA: LuxR C-terminal-related transcriptional regulator, partial [Candidatus Tectomicrobia bacterium]|nr:LuxR C-terminal-related transcriptional regulator [Candidatus Tectomicrobia bacterium]
ELEAGEARLRDAERWLDTTADMGARPEVPAAAMVVVDEAQFRSLPAAIATARARQAQALGDVPGTVQYARRALDLLPEDAYYARGVPAALLAVASWASGDLEAAHRSFADFMANMRLAGNILVAISGTFVLADIRMVQGRLHEALGTYQRSLQLATAQGEPVLRGTADLYVGLAELQCEQGDLEAASQHLLTSQALGERATLPELRYRSCLAMARIKEAQGDLDGALDLLHEAERLYIRGPVSDVRPVAALKTRVWVKQGRLTEALGWARERGLSAHDDLSYLREFEHVTLARVLSARYTSGRGERSMHEAMGLLERLLKAAEEGARAGSAIEILVLQALAHEAQGNLPHALPPLARALTLAEPEGYVRRFVDEGMPMARLLSAAAARGILPDYTGTLLAAFAAEAHQGEDPSHPPPAQRTRSLAGPLSRREREILQLIARGLSNREIGERLFLALDTVKGHNRGIFGKLRVQRRTEAVAKARSLNILPPH